MANTTPTTAKTANTGWKLPPDERLWKRYSPHHEFSLSSIGSVAIHALVIGMLVLIGYLMAWAGFNQPPKKVSQGIVTLSGGGGGGTADGAKDLKGKTKTEAALPERGPADGNREKHNEPTPAAPVLDVDSIARKAPKEWLEDKKFTDYLQSAKVDKSKAWILNDFATQSENDLMSAVSKISKNAGRDGPKDSGPGKDGGKDGGKGGTDKGADTMGKRKQRMLRWVMSFNTAKGGSYFEQLKGLGAVIAIPTEKSAKNPAGYKAIFWPAGVKKVDNVADLNRIYWKDFDPASVRQVLKGSDYKGPAVDHFVALMPQELEDKLYEMEKTLAEKKGHSIDDVFETKFEVRQSGFKFEPVLLEQTYK